MVDRAGQQLGNYRLIRLLGQGGFAEVYLGEHIYLNTQVAVKVLRTQLVGNDIEEFLTEARTNARLIHPNIIRVFDFGVEDYGSPFLVMDYAPHGTLRQRHPKGEILPLPIIVSYVKQVAAALQYIHDQNLIHRDIKPENMLVNQHEEVLLSDFGISLIAQSSGLQSIKEVVGTASYMSPEQIQGKPRAASDQYALGIVVYEWLCGERPFRGSLAEQLSQHMFAPLPLLREKLPGISSAVEIVVLTALAKEPKQRFASIQAFANALEQASNFSRSASLEMLPDLSPFSIKDTPTTLRNSSPPSRRGTRPTDIIPTLPTAPYIAPLSTTEGKDAPSPPPAVEEQILPGVPSWDYPHDAPTERSQGELPSSPQGQLPPAVPATNSADFAPTNYASPPRPTIPTVPPVPLPQQQSPKNLPASRSIDDSPAKHLPATPPPVAAKEQRPSTASSNINKCPYCDAETRPGDNFCLNCGSRLISPIPSPQQAAVPLGDMTIPAQDEILDYATQEARDEKVGTLLGNLTMPSVVSPWIPEKDASALVPDEQIGAGAQSIIVSQSSAIVLPGPTQAPNQAKEDLLNEGDSLYKAKRYMEALAVYESVIQMDSQDARAHNNRGNALWRLKRHKQALAAYELASTLEPTNALIWLAKGNFLYSQRRYDDALTDYKRAKSIDPFNHSIHVSIGNAFYALRRYDAALVAYEEALKIAPEDTSILIAQGEVFYKQRRYKEAFEAYDRAIRINPDDERIWFAKGNKLYKLKRYKEALTAYERVLGIIDTNASIWSTKGNVLYRLEQYTEALEAYNKALTITPRRARTWADKGAVLYKLKRYDEALDAYKFARFLDPNDATISERYDMLCDRLRDLKAGQISQIPVQTNRKDIQQQPKPGPVDVPGSPRVRNQPEQPTHIGTPHDEAGRESKKTVEGTQPQKKYHVFLSHSHMDAQWVENLAMRLVDEHNFNVWLDKWMLIPGQDWIQSIAEGIDQAHCCAICIGEQTPIGWFEREIKRALDRQAKEKQKGQSFGVFAILLPGAKDVNVDDFLGLNTWVDFRDADTDYAFHVLVSGIKGEPPGRWPLKETLSSMAPADLEAKLRDLHRFEEKSWVHPTVAVEFQRMVLKKLLLDIDESEGQPE